MRASISFVSFLLGLAIVQALPTEKADSLKKDLEIEDIGEDTDRSKKSILCLDSSNLMPQAQTYSIQAAAQPLQTLSIQQPVQTLGFQTASQPLQTLNIQPAAQPLQTLNIQPVPTLNFQPQPVQSLNLIQSQPQSVNLIHSQPQPQVHIAPQPQPQQYNVEVVPNKQTPCQTNVNIIQPMQEEKVPVQAPETEVEIIHKEKIVRPQPKPEKIVEREEVIVPIYKEEIMVPQKQFVVMEQQPMTYLNMPQCNQCQQSLMQCTCRQQQAAALRSGVILEPPRMQLVGVRGSPRALAPMHGSGGHIHSHAHSHTHARNM